MIFVFLICVIIFNLFIGSFPSYICNLSIFSPFDHTNLKFQF